MGRDDMLLLVRGGFLGDRKNIEKELKGYLPMWFWEGYLIIRWRVDGRFRQRILYCLLAAKDMPYWPYYLAF